MGRHGRQPQHAQGGKQDGIGKIVRRFATGQLQAAQRHAPACGCYDIPSSQPPPAETPRCQKSLKLDHNAPRILA
jgi:hypothetical protein